MILLLLTFRKTTNIWFTFGCICRSCIPNGICHYDFQDRVVQVANEFKKLNIFCDESDIQFPFLSLKMYLNYCKRVHDWFQLLLFLVYILNTCSKFVSPCVSMSKIKEVNKFSRTCLSLLNNVRILTNC